MLIMRIKRKLMQIYDGYFDAVKECQPYCYANLFKIFKKYEDTHDFGISRQMMPYAKIVAQMYVNDSNVSNNVFKSKVKLIQL